MQDLISRQTVFDTITEYRNQLRDIFGEENELIRVVDIVKHRLIALQSAQPYTEAELQKMQDLYQAEIDKAFELGQEDARSEIIHCVECKHRDPEDHKCDCGHDILWQLPRDDEWYCADAERKEGEADERPM